MSRINDFKLCHHHEQGPAFLEEKYLFRSYIIILLLLATFTFFVIVLMSNAVDLS